MKIDVSHIERRRVTIYGLAEYPSGNVFYIGATQGDLNQRLYSHLSRGVVGSIYAYFYDLLAKGSHVEIFQIDTTNVKGASFWEEHYIDLFFSFGFKLIQRRHSDYSKQQINKYINKITGESGLVRKYSNSPAIKDNSSLK